jgi:copper transport protein
MGSDSFVLQLMNGDGTPLPAKAATLVLSRPTGGVPPVEYKAALGADRYWHVENVAMPSAGRWHMRIEAETSFRTIGLEEDFDLPGP